MYLFLEMVGTHFVLDFKLCVTLTSDREIELSEVIFGDVWLCSGQSNMAMKMKRIANSTEEITKSADYNIRFTVLKNNCSFNEDDFRDTPIEVPWSDVSQGYRLR